MIVKHEGGRALGLAVAPGLRTGLRWPMGLAGMVPYLSRFRRRQEGELR